MNLQRISFPAALAAVFILTGCGSSGVGDILGGGRGPSETGGYNQITNVRGTVERLNTTERYIVVDREASSYNLRNDGEAGGEIVLYYDDNTRVEHQGKTYRPADLEAGDRILADVNQGRDGGRLYVEEIQVLYDVTSGSGDRYGSDDRYGDDRYGDDRYGPRTTEVRGTVRYVDSRAQTVELDPATGRSGPLVVYYDSNTIVEFEGRRYRPDNLERGDRVEIEVREADSGDRRDGSNARLIASEILVVSEARSR